MIALVCLSLGCVRTAECDEHVGCAAEQVCYEHRCLKRCQSQPDCLESQVCTPCIDEATRATGGRCMNEDAMVCLESDSQT